LDAYSRNTDADRILRPREKEIVGKGSPNKKKKQKKNQPKNTGGQTAQAVWITTEHKNDSI